ncbi:MAG: MinD/ParA family protein [Anaerolineae bacterium]|nr:MinD/ParA family protein [Anaerolineae bacterium]
MARIVSVHSFRGGTGKSNITANLAALIAMSGGRVGIVDTDIASPGIHVLFGLKEDTIVHSLNDYLWGRCTIQQAARDVTDRAGKEIPGRIFLVPSSVEADEIGRVLSEGYDVGLLNEGFRHLIKEFNLDLLLVDTHPGLNEDTLLSVAISDLLLIILRPDQQDYLGTGVAVEIARRLRVPQMMLVVNKVPALFSEAEVKARVEEAYGAEVAAVLPHSDEMMVLASGGIFVTRYPTHPMAANLKPLAERLAV